MVCNVFVVWTKKQFELKEKSHNSYVILELHSRKAIDDFSSCLRLNVQWTFQMTSQQVVRLFHMSKSRLVESALASRRQKFLHKIGVARKRLYFELIRCTFPAFCGLINYLSTEWARRKFNVLVVNWPQKYPSGRSNNRILTTETIFMNRKSTLQLCNMYSDLL